MSNTIGIVIRDKLAKYITDSAIDGACEAIVKLINDGFVRKELYKEKLGRVNSLYVELKTAKEALAAAEDKIVEFSTKFKDRKDDVYKELALKTLEAYGAIPQFTELLYKEFEFNPVEIQEDVEFSDYLSLQIQQMKLAYPYAFGEFSVEKAAIASNPIQIQHVNNPWKRDTLDLEEQTRLYRTDPSSARDMANSVGIRLT